MSLECLNNVVGVTSSASQCVTGGLTPETIALLTKSTSGLYLEALPGGVELKSLTQMGNSQSMADMSLKAINQAIKMTEDAVTVGLAVSYKSERGAFDGEIGSPAVSGSITPTYGIQGLKLQPVSNSDGVLYVRRIRLYLDTSGPVQIQILRVPYGASQGEVYKSYTCNVVANVPTEATLPEMARLQLNEGGQRYEFYIVYNINELSGAKYKDVKIGCDSCNKKNNLTNFVTVIGMQTSSTNDLTSQVLTDKFTHGLIVDVKATCDSGLLYCREFDNNNAIAVTMSYAVWYKAGELLCEYVLESGDVNRYTTMSREYLYGKRNTFRTEFEQRIKYLIDPNYGIDVSSSNCYVCNEKVNTPFVGGIFS